MDPSPTEVLAQALVDVGSRLHRAGLLPATSGNLSVRRDPDCVLLTASGLDKGRLRPSDLLGFTPAGEALGRVLPRPRDGATLRPSAETALHLQLYRRDPSVGAVLHVHGEAATVLSMVVKRDTLVLTGFELLKALRGVTHHDAQVALPILDNDQDMEALAAQVEARLDAAPGVPGYLLRGHGLYTWGADLAEAERHVEALDFLFRCKLRLRQEGWR